MHFLTEDDNLLEKCNTIWDKASADINKRNLIANLPIKKTLQITDQAAYFYDNETLKAVSDCPCSAVMAIDTAL